jgi:hypothetical protein
MEPTLLYIWETSQAPLHLYQNQETYTFTCGEKPILNVSGIEDLAFDVDQFCKTNFFHLADDLSSLVFFQDGSTLPKSFSFSPLEKTEEIETQPPVSKHRRIFQGLNFLGKCTNEKCKAFDRLIVIPQHLGEFSIAPQLDCANCPACKAPISHTQIHQLAFFDCLATIQGMREGVRVEKTLIAGNSVLTGFEEGQPVNWVRLTVTTTPRPWSWRCTIL